MSVIGPILAVAMIIGAVLFVAWALGAFSQPPSSSNDYDVSLIKRGDTKDQVLAIFGKPKGVTNGSFGESWNWYVPMRLYASVDFNDEGRVKRTYRNGTPVRG